jgi:small-conductance mechanosensitive channel
MGVAAIAATLLISSFTPNRLIKRKLRLSLYLAAAYVALQVVLLANLIPALRDLDPDLRAIERLAFAAAIINVIVVGLLNPLRHDRVPDAFPSILQDAIVIGIFVLIATFVFHDKLFTTSAVGAVVVGFALQDTLGNAFAGLAIQSEKPFRMGDWVRVGDFEGRVTEVTWRATKLRTKTGNFVIVPNSKVSQEAITNFSEPAVPTRLEVEVGASYLATPGDVKGAILEAIRQVPRVLTSPPPDALLASFDASAITYKARFWIDQYEADEAIRSEVRTAIFYSFARRGIDIPWPIQVEYSREWPGPDLSAKQTERERILAGVDLFSRLTDEQRRDVAAATTLRTYGDGEAIVRQGDAGGSMFVVSTGKVAVVLEPEGREVAAIDAGAYFGEMSLLTGEPRTASVVARGDTTVLELDADVFRRLAEHAPYAVEEIGLAAIKRRARLEQVRDSAKAAAIVEPPASLLERMKKYLRLV